nr:hypothetical protein Itr_chr10CG12970 [Ipomoea trifida]
MPKQRVNLVDLGAAGFGADELAPPGAAYASLKSIEVSCASPCEKEQKTYRVLRRQASAHTSRWGWQELSFVSGSSDLREKVYSRKSFEGRGGLFIGDARGNPLVPARMWRRIKRWPGRLGIAVHPESLLYVAIVALWGERAR